MELARGSWIDPGFVANLFANKRRCHLEKRVVPRTRIQQQQQQPGWLIKESAACDLLYVAMGPGPFQVIYYFRLEV